MLLATLIGIGWVYFSYREDFGLPFAISIITMYVLILVYSIVSWRSYAFKKENLEESSTSYISYQLQKLNWQRKTLTTYIWIYTFLLWLAVILYELEVADRGTVLFKFTLIGITTAYLFGITAWSRFKKPQKHLAEIDEIVIELKNIQKSLND
jgi:Ca2+/Na+ antiporter